MTTTATATVTHAAHARLTRSAKLLGQKYRSRLDDLKGGARDLNRRDWLWYSLLLSFSTMGNSRGVKLIRDKGLYSRVTFGALAELSAIDREKVLKDTLRAGTVRMADRKAAWLCENFCLIEEMGGPQSAKALLLAQQGCVAKMEWLKQFRGIGKKYSRNMMMDVYHPDFHQSIAIDQRILAISKKLGLSFKRYEDHEEFYLGAAHDAGLQGWELDRLMYNFTDEFLQNLGLHSN